MTVVRELIALLSLEADAASFEEAESLVGAVEAGLAMVGAAAAAAAAAITAMVDEAGMLADLSDQLGLDAERLQELGAAAELNSVSFDGFAATLRGLAKNAKEAIEGNEALAKSFKDAGVDLKGADGKLRPLDDILLQVAARIATMPAGAERAALAMDLLGKQGATLIPMLKDGPEGIARLAAEARDLGAVMSADTVNAADELGDTLDRLSLATKGLRNLVGAPLLQPVLELAQGLLAWVRANREVIASSIERVVRFTAASIRMLLQVASPLARLLKVLALDAGGLNVALVLLSIATLAYGGNAVRSAIASTLAWIASMKAKITVTEVYTNMLGKTTTAVRLMTVAELKAAAVTALAPYAIAAAWGALFILLGLLIEDIYVAFQGGDSIFTRWASWIHNALRFEDDDGGLVRFLKWVGMLFFDNMRAGEIFRSKVRGIFRDLGDYIMGKLKVFSDMWAAIGIGDFAKAGALYTELLGPFGKWLQMVGRIFEFIGSVVMWIVNAGGRLFEGVGKMLGAFAAGEGKAGFASLLDGLGAVGDWVGANVTYGRPGEELPLDRILGRGASGAASVAGAAGGGLARSTVNAPVLHYSPQIQVGPGTDPQAVVDAGRTGFEQWMDGQLRTALANIEGG